MLVFIGILIAMFSIMSMQLMLTTILPLISLELNGAHLYSWIFSGYMIASIMTIPLFSRLADIYGKRKFFIIGSLLFIVGSIIGVVSVTMEQLLVARIVQGAAAGILIPVTLAMISEMFEPDKRGTMIGIFGLVQLITNIISPILGNVITTYFNWQTTFVFSIVLLALSLIIVLFGKIHHEERTTFNLRDIDIMGGILFGLISAQLVYLLNTYIYSLTYDLKFFAFIFVLTGSLIALIVIEKKHQYPVIQPSFFQHKIIRRSIISSVLLGAIMYGFITILPLISLATVNSVNEINKATLLLYFMIGSTAGLLAGSKVYKFIKHFPLFIWLLMVVSLVASMGFLVINNINLFKICVMLVGIGVGALMATVMIYSQNSVTDSERTVLSGIVQLARYFGAAVGIALLVSVIPSLDNIVAFSDFKITFYVLIALGTTGVLNELL